MMTGGMTAAQVPAIEEMSSAKRRKGWAGFAAVLVMGGALAYGYTRYTAYQKEQEQARIEQERQEQLRVQAEQERIRKEQEVEQERLRIAREKAEAERKQAERERLQAERERQAAERARQEAERRARQTPARKRDLNEYEIKRIARRYGFEIRSGKPTHDEANWYALNNGLERYDIYAKRYWGFLLPMYYVAVMSVGVRYTKAEMFEGHGGIIYYDDLRNNPSYTLDYIREKVQCMDEHQNQLVLMLMELKELE